MSGRGAFPAGPPSCITEFERDKSHLYAGEKQDRLWERRSGGGSDATKATPNPGHWPTFQDLSEIGTKKKGTPSPFRKDFSAMWLKCCLR